MTNLPKENPLHSEREEQGFDLGAQVALGTGAALTQKKMPFGFWACAVLGLGALFLEPGSIRLLLFSCQSTKNAY